jgi:polyhydroxybutyrate depolymerase
LRGRLKIACLSTPLVAVALVGLAVWAMRNSRPPMPKLAGHIERGALEHGGRTRTWIAYLPPRPAAHPALLLVLHASMGTGERVRAVFGYDFDLLADREGFIAVYPQDYEGHWNDCKAKGPFAAKRENVDDVGFLQALVDRLVKDHDVDRARVYVAGVSNGGAMVLRLALQTPSFARAYAAVVSSVPTPENMALTPRNQPVSILLMNGTGDPFVPWRGGDVVLYGVWGNRGPVLAAQASIDYFRKLAGLDGAPQVTRFPDLDPSDGSTVERSLWSAPDKHSVALYTIEGGGHGVPHPAVHGPRLLGRSNRDIHAANEIWEFFQTSPRVPAVSQRP